MSPGDDDRRLPVGERRIGERLAGHAQSTPQGRQNAPATQVFAHGYLIVGKRGRCRLLLIVARCPYCHRPHVHNGKPDFVAGKRQAACHEGRYLVHLGTVEGEVAA